MSISQILEESGPLIADLIDPSPYASEVQWFYRNSMESLAAFGRIKNSPCGVKIHVHKASDDFTSLSITAEVQYDVSFQTLILTKTLTTEVLLDYVVAGILFVTAEVEENGRVD